MDEESEEKKEEERWHQESPLYADGRRDQKSAIIIRARLTTR